MGRYCDCPCHVSDDLYVHRGQEQLSQRQHTYSKAGVIKLFLHTADVSFSYLVLIAGFFFAPASPIDFDEGDGELLRKGTQIISLSFWESMKWHITSWW